MTSDLDLRDAVYVQFFFLLGCTVSAQSRDEGVLVQYSTSAGVMWTTLRELYYDQYKQVKYVYLYVLQLVNEHFIATSRITNISAIFLTDKDSKRINN